MITITKRFHPGEPGDMFDTLGRFDESEVGNRVECKACARRVPSTQSMMSAHADRPQKRSDGSTGTCAEFWEQ
jgi:hypothetical protein